MEKPKLHSGIYNFLYQRGCNLCQMQSVLFHYAIEKGIKKPKKGRLQWYVGISELASQNFAEFKKFYNKNKDPNTMRKKSYDEWWSEANLDGSFAYNGCTEDF